MLTIGSALLVIAILGILMHSHSSKDVLIRMFVLTAVVELLVGRGFFIDIGGKQVYYRTICEYILLVVAIYHIWVAKTCVDRLILCRVLILLGCIVLGLLFLALFPTDATGATASLSWDAILTNGLSRQPIEFSFACLSELGRITRFLIVTAIVLSTFQERDWCLAVSKFLNWSSILICVGFIEVISKYMFNSNAFHETADFLLGVSTSTFLDISKRGEGYALCAFMKEASHFTFSLTVLMGILLSVFVSDRREKCGLFCRQYYLIALLIIIELGLSMSFSSLYFACCLFLLALVLVARKSSCSHALFVVALLTGIAFIGAAVVSEMPKFITGDSYLGNRISRLSGILASVLDGTWLSKGTTGDFSTAVRIGSTYETLLLVAERPIVGLGYGIASAHSSLAMMLAGCGLGGFALYFNAVFRSFVPDGGKMTYYCLVVVFLVETLFASITYRPFCEAWLLIMLFSFSRATIIQPCLREEVLC